MIPVSLDVGFLHVVNGLIYYKNLVIGKKVCLIRDNLFRGIIIAHNNHELENHMKVNTQRN